MAGGRPKKKARNITELNPIEMVSGSYIQGCLIALTYKTVLGMVQVLLSWDIKTKLCNGQESGSRNPWWMSSWSYTTFYQQILPFHECIQDRADWESSGVGCAKAETALSCFTACNDGDRGRPVIVLLPNINQKYHLGVPKNWRAKNVVGKTSEQCF